MRNGFGSLMLATGALLALTACAPASPLAAPVTEDPRAMATEATAQEVAAATTAAEPVTVTLMTHDSFNVSEEVIVAFEAQTGITVKLLPSGDAGAALNQAILSRNNPLADVFFGVDNTFLGRALAAGIFEPYQSPLLTDVPDELELDPEHRLSPIDYGDVCLNYDKAWFKEHNLQPPANLEALTDVAYTGLTVVENPATSSPGLAFLLATVGRFGEDGFLDYWRALRENDLLVVDGWEEAYWGEFTAASDGDRPIAVSYASSPPVEVLYAEEPVDGAPTGVVVADGACFRQIEFAGILKGTKQPQGARLLIDFLLGVSFQEDIPLQMFVFPANEKAVLPELYQKYAIVPEETSTVAPEAIEANREKWIEAWTEAVLR